jgi:hypothetical protein
MKKIILIIFILFGSYSSLSAHGSKVSSFFLAESTPGVWNIQINASMAAFQYEYLAFNDKESLENIAPDDFKNWIITHLKQEIDIIVNGKKITFGEGYVKPAHETLVKILLNDMPEDIKSISVTNKSLINGIPNHKSYFKIIREENYSEMFPLSFKNNYSTRLEYSLGKLKLKGTTSNTDYFYYSLFSGFVVLTILIISVFYIKKKKKRNL